jgi:hypothetical protein
MTKLVSLEQAKFHLRIDDASSGGNDDDTDLELKIRAASAAVLRYIGLVQDWLDSSGEPIVESGGDTAVPADVVAATLLLVGDLYKERDGKNESDWEHGFLPLSVRSLLFPLRTPVIA